MNKEILPVQGPSVWHGDTLSNCPRWQFRIELQDIEEIESALACAKSSGSDITTINRRRFPLKRLAKKLQRMAEELESGCGFVRMRGLPIENWNRQELEVIWMGIASYIGKPVFQNPHGQLLREIRAEDGDVGSRYGQLDTGQGSFLSSRARTASNAELRFHTDRADVVGLLCTGRAKSGGTSRIASSAAVHNAMLELSPILCQTLYAPLARSRIGEEAGGEDQWYLLPVWGVRNDKFTSHYSRTYVEALEHIDGAPVISKTQWQALDLLAELASKYALEMSLHPGDIQLLNNHVIYHARTEFRDAPEERLVRSLLRIWICSLPNHRALPEDHRVLWGQIEKGELRGGIAQA